MCIKKLKKLDKNYINVELNKNDAILSTQNILSLKS